MATTVTVPDSLVQAWNVFDRNHVAVIGVLVVALLASIVTEVVKRKYNAKQFSKMLVGEEWKAIKLSKKAIAWILTASTTLFTSLGYVLFLYQGNKSFVAQVPYIGTGVTEAVGVGYLLYNLRLNKSYTTFVAWAGKFSKSPTASNLPQPAAPASGDDQLA